ncbi:MAG: YdhR family protein [Chloroflexi bacterium]|nr:YdhR family protein [Chloroflexota bacterium]
MHVQVVQFHLKGLSHADFLKVCDQLAPTWAEVPGMLAKIWLSDPAANTYGGVYTWEDRAAMQRYTQSELWQAVLTNPNFADVTSRDYAVLEGPTKVTRGWATVRA